MVSEIWGTLWGLDCKGVLLLGGLYRGSHIFVNSQLERACSPSDRKAFEDIGRVAKCEVAVSPNPLW